MSDSVPTAGRPDTLFALVAGLYASLLFVPVGLLAAGISDVASMYVAFLFGTVVVTTVVTIAVRRAVGLPEWLGAGPRRFLPAVAPGGFVLFVGGFQTFLLGRALSERTLLLGAVAGIGSVAVGGLLSLMADTRYAKAVTESARVDATWRAPWPERPRRRVRYVGGGVAVACGLLFVVGAVFDIPVVRYGAQFVLPLGIVVSTWGQARTYRATSAGLELQAPANRHLYRWEQFEGYMLTEEAIVLHHRAPWRLPMYCDRSALDDAEAVQAALGQYLPRLH